MNSVCMESKRRKAEKMNNNRKERARERERRKKTNWDRELFGENDKMSVRQTLIAIINGLSFKWSGVTSRFFVCVRGRGENRNLDYVMYASILSLKLSHNTMNHSLALSASCSGLDFFVSLLIFVYTIRMIVRWRKNQRMSERAFSFLPQQLICYRCLSAGARSFRLGLQTIGLANKRCTKYHTNFFVRKRACARAFVSFCITTMYSLFCLQLTMVRCGCAVMCVYLCMCVCESFLFSHCLLDWHCHSFYHI